MRNLYRLGLIAVLLFLSQPRLRAQAPDPLMGNPVAAVRVVVYQDLQCPYCAAWHKEMLSSVIPAYGGRVAFEFRDFIITTHPWSYNAALFARYMDLKDPKLGLAWRDYCFTHQDDIEAGNLLDTAARYCAGAGITRAQLASADRKSVV